ncbi:hypothetical protein AMS68_004202 [Peltaster fructicola]|uniref:6-phosphogluconolactonase n=1 Tax=Peltaster fructicola TaxID=286661 RepID=A0A6H0XVK2_9PEZI|nr:hypothetical protein AMS68_004202 [Peltaster fructicola]
MRVITLVVTASASVLATNLFVSSYAGDISSLALSESRGVYNLTKTSTTADCGPNPSWLTIDVEQGLLFCLNEGLTTPNGSLSSFTISHDGSLTHVQNTTTISGPVNGVIYGNPLVKRGIALAHYTGSAVTAYCLEDAGHFEAIQSLQFTLAAPGAVPERQDAPHEHEAITDPTGRYLLVPDLGADLVRVFAIDADTLELTATAPLSTVPGTGPRHAAFYNPYAVVCESCTTFLYVVGELSSDVTGYAVTYLSDGSGLNFTQVYQSSTLGLLNHERINAPAEVHVSPDNRFLIISNRNSTLFSLPNRDPKNSTTIPSDSLTTFSLQRDGSLVFVQAWPSGGLYPRQFTLDSTGSLVAVGNQLSGNVVILSRDVGTGLIGEPVAVTAIEGNVTCVVFDA